MSQHHLFLETLIFLEFQKFVVNMSKTGLLVNKINPFLLLFIIRVDNKSFYQLIPLEKPYFKKLKKKASHKCGRVMGNLIFKPNS